MAPRTASMTQVQKLDKVLSFFHESATCHTLKDLETSIPAATKINKMHVKDLIKELTDTNQVKMEKIGSGNWYWAWAGQEVAEKTNTIAQLESEQSALNASISSIQQHLTDTTTRLANLKDDLLHSQLLQDNKLLRAEVDLLIIETAEWDNAIAGGFDEKREQVKQHRARALEATDNIIVLETYLRRHLQIGTEELDGLRQECYGQLYRAGCDFLDLDDDLASC